MDAVLGVQEVEKIIKSEFKWTDQCATGKQNARGRLFTLRSALAYFNLEAHAIVIPHL